MLRKSSKKPLNKILNKLQKLVNEYVRRSNANFDGFCECVTCGEVKHWKKIHAGHFFPTSVYKLIRFDLRNIHPQCPRCNLFLSGNLHEYYTFMKEKYGEEVIQELKTKTGNPFTIPEIEEMISEYKRKLLQLG